MYQTGKQYGLNITTYVDERSDPIKASQAASQYMKNMYQIFGDWDLVLASYNSGPGNVAKAIRRSGGQQNYWNIRKNLPKETQGYVPAFLATMYIFEYHKEHGIVPNKAIANHFATDTIHIKNHITFKQLSDLLDIPVNEIQFFNPSFKRKEIPAISGQQQYIRLPKDKVAMFTSNEEKIYAYVKHEADLRERPFEQINRPKDTSAIAALKQDFITKTRYHKVRRGDNLTAIAAQYDVTVTDIKRWNRLKSDRAPVGRRLKIKMPEEIVVKNSKNEVVKDSIPKAIASPDKATDLKYETIYKTEKVVVNKDVVKYHNVKSGDVLGAIAGKYNVSVAELRKWNKIKGNNIGIGDKLKIIKNEKLVTTVRKEVRVPSTNRNDALVTNDKSNTVEKIKTIGIQDSTKSVNYYVVAKGDNLSTIAKKYNTTVDQLKAWNNLIDNTAKLGTQLIISSDAVAQVREEDVAPKKEIRTEEYTVGRGDNLGLIAKKYNTTVDQLKAWNNRTDNALQVGEKLVVNKTEITRSSKTKTAVATNKTKETLYRVRKGDSLFSISKKFPGVTIADIKRWNNIKGESITPGMKLKING
jgi:membrane-bound lytic murein transglycosylase D